MIALPELVPWWVAALTGVIGVCGGVLIHAIVSGEAFETGKAVGQQEGYRAGFFDATDRAPLDDPIDPTQPADPREPWRH